MYEKEGKGSGREGEERRVRVVERSKYVQRRDVPLTAPSI
jgi:hypothetical protein